MKTRITELFGIQHPIIQGGMHFVGLPELASAVSNAGGLGMITALTLGTPEKLAAAIKRCHEMTDKPFGVNLTFLPTFANPPYAELIQAIVEGGVRIVETAGRSPEQYLPVLKQHGVKVIHKCTSVRHSLKAEKIGCDAVSVDGFECGGHPGEDDVPNFILLPLAAEALKIPFVASGGMADGRSLVAALALGAEGMNMGTRFIATKEAPVHENVKQALVQASELDTRLIMRSLRNTERVLRNAAVDKVVEIEKQKGAATTIDDIREYVAGAYVKVMQQGDMEAGAWSCGMVAGLIHDVPTCRELVDRIMARSRDDHRAPAAGHARRLTVRSRRASRTARCGRPRGTQAPGSSSSAARARTSRSSSRRRRTGCGRRATRWYLSTTEVCGSLPMRAVPSRCGPPVDSATGSFQTSSAPAACMDSTPRSCR